MPKRVAPIAETDLYQPVHDYLVAHGYTVRSEVRHCDIAAVKGDELIVIELKRALNLALLAQAVARQRITEAVYVAIPRPPNKRRWLAQTKGIHDVLRRLEVGLILVGGQPAVEVVFHPLPTARRRQKRTLRAVLREIDRRSADYNQGGSCRRKLVTAYRENAIQVAVCLAVLGPSTPRALRARATGEKTLTILSRNVYGWFERIARGVYALNEKGYTALTEYPELAARYREPLHEQHLCDVSAP